MYWDLVGPGNTPSGKTDYQWGQMQADAAVNAFASVYADGPTIFADIETGNAGNWGGFSHSRDQSIVNGWNDEILRKGFYPGIYISYLNWNAYLTSSFKPTTHFVLWLTGCHTNVTCNPGTGTTCACDPRSAAQSLWHYPAASILGGCRTVVWQYRAGAEDYDLTTTDPLNFAPSTSSTTYYLGC